MKKEKICSICSGEITKEVNGWDGGHNAEPINEGRCCGQCNDNFVVPRRIKDFFDRKQEGAKA